MPQDDLPSEPTRKGCSPHPAKGSTNPRVSQPDDPLHIYYLHGRIPSKRFQGHPDFLGSWQEDGLSFLFFSKPAREEVAGLASAEPDIDFIEEFQTTYGQWQGGTISSFSEGGLIFCPPWEDDACGDGPVLRFDPGVVFGTGLHPTTRDCIRALERICRSGSPGTVLDLGTGSGILALAAAAFRAELVVAVDCNPLAVQTAARNIGLNDLQDRVLPVQSLAEGAAALPADVLVANIHFDAMQRLLDEPGFFEKPRFILSGLMSRQAEAIRRRLSEAGAEIETFWISEDGWVTLAGRNHSGHGLGRASPEESHARFRPVHVSGAEIRGRNAEHGAAC